MIGFKAGKTYPVENPLYVSLEFGDDACFAIMIDENYHLGVTILILSIYMIYGRSGIKIHAKVAIIRNSSTQLKKIKWLALSFIAALILVLFLIR